MSPQEWSGPMNEGGNEGGGWQDAPPGQPPGQNYQQPPYQEQSGEQQPQDPRVQQWQQQSQQAPSSGGGMQIKLDAKVLNFGILLGVLLAWLGRIILIFADSTGGFDAANFLSGTGAFLAVGAAIAAVALIPNLEKTTRLGYLIFAGFVFMAI